MKKKKLFFRFFQKFSKYFWLGGAAPQTRELDPPLNGRSPHLIEAAKRGRLDQMIFFGAADDKGAADNTGAADDRPT